METNYLVDFCDFELENNRNSKVSDQVERNISLMEKEFLDLQLNPKEVLRLFFKDRVLTPAKPFRIEVLEDYLLNYYEKDITDKLIQLLLSTHFLENYKGKSYYVPFTEYIWLYEKTLYKSANEQCSYSYNKLTDKIDDFLFQYRKYLLFLSYYSNVYSENDFLESNACKKILKEKAFLDKAETQMLNALGEFHVAVDSIYSNIERNKNVKSGKFTVKPICIREDLINKE